MFPGLGYPQKAFPDWALARGGGIPGGATSKSEGARVAKGFPPLSPAIAHLRERIARIERIHARGAAEPSIPLGIEAIDHGCPPAASAWARCMKPPRPAPTPNMPPPPPCSSPVSWPGWTARCCGCCGRPTCSPPASPAPACSPDRIVFAEAGKDVLPAMEEGLRHPGLAAVVAEQTARLSLVASRRLQLAAEQAGILAILLRRSPSSTIRP